MISPLLPVFARADVAFERGDGAYLYASDGRRYLDFASGVAVTMLGHCHPHLVKALNDQAGKLWHSSNLFRMPEGERLAKRMIEHTFADTVFFANSGAEAVECAIKVARAYHAGRGNPERFRVITFAHAFHGRTLATLAATGNQAYLKGFGPKVEGFDQVAIDLEAARKAIGPETAAFLIEPVQGEGGVRVHPEGFLAGLRALADQHGMLLVYDEVQCGNGRTGKLYAHQLYGVAPDIMATAKALGGGFPIGACLATERAASGMAPGSHGSTFGGNQLAMAVANAVYDIILDPEFLEGVARKGHHIRQQLAMLQERHPDVIEEVRGVGVMLGIKCRKPNDAMVAALRNRGLLSVGAGENVVRLYPPMIVSEAQIGEAIDMIDGACREFRSKAA
ncbi:MAG: aspartate aminotransferase family protein [Alphaproteobacteria bacterium]|nr:aspartate aminotransferase family protein [Alphaproteobacteria bacterium]